MPTRRGARVEFSAEWYEALSQHVRILSMICEVVSWTKATSRNDPFSPAAPFNCHGPARPGHLSRHVLAGVARTSRAMTEIDRPIRLFLGVD